MKKALSYRALSLVLIAAAAICAVGFWLSADFAPGDARDRLTRLSEGWYYLDGAGAKVPVELPCEIEAGERLELFHDGGALIDAGQVLSTCAAVYDVEIYAGGELIYQYADNGREVNRAVRGNIVCSGAIPEALDSSELRLVYHGDGRYRLPEVTLSTAGALIKSVFLQSLFCLAVSVAMLVLGLLTLAFDLAMSLQRERDGRIFFIGLFLITCGLWCLSDSRFVHLLAGYSDLIFTLDFYLFMLMPIPLAHFVLCTGEMKAHRMLRCIPLLYYINIIAQSILAALGVFTFFRMLYATHLLMMFCGVVCSLTVLLRAYRTRKEGEILLCIRVLTSVGLLGAVAILLYVFAGYATYQLIYQTGLLLLMSVLLSALLKAFMRGVRYRAEALVYKRLSEQDKLTGLDNRRAFDALAEKIGNDSLRCRDAALMFMDVNFLKRANDSFGHDFGDRLLVGAAQCILKAFGALGYCYRIGGDEFCAVILNPSCRESELLSRLDAEIERFNRRSPQPLDLSIACGCSFIGEHSVRKSLDAWRKEADERMYAEKKRAKACRES